MDYVIKSTICKVIRALMLFVAVGIQFQSVGRLFYPEMIIIIPTIVCFLIFGIALIIFTMTFFYERSVARKNNQFYSLTKDVDISLDPLDERELMIMTKALKKSKEVTSKIIFVIIVTLYLWINTVRLSFELLGLPLYDVEVLYLLFIFLLCLILIISDVVYCTKWCKEYNR